MGSCKKIFLVGLFALSIPGAAFAQLGPFDASVDVDGGALGAAGSSSLVDDTYLVQGSGHDIWNRADDFHFLHKKWCGDFELSASFEVNGGAESQTWAKAELMVREDLSAGSRFYGAIVRRDGLSYIQWRPRPAPTETETSAEAVSVETGFQSKPGKHKLIRRGDTLFVYSFQGGEWRLKFADKFDFPEPFYIGLAVTSHDTGILATGTFTAVDFHGLVPNCGS